MGQVGGWGRAEGEAVNQMYGSTVSFAAHAAPLSNSACIRHVRGGGGMKGVRGKGEQDYGWRGPSEALLHPLAPLTLLPPCTHPLFPRNIACLVVVAVAGLESCHSVTGV